MNLLNDIERLVICESPSTDLAAVARSAEVTAEVGTALLGASPERIVLDGRTHLRWRLGSGPRKVLLLGHHDTVWPIGTLERIPFEVRDGVLRGPGCFDMKTGVAMIFHAVAALDSPDGVTVLITGDEEIGSPSSRGLIEAEALQHTAVLVTEASADGGALKTERKGTSLYEVTLHGRAAHAGLEPERGVNATIEAAHQVLAVSRLADPSTGTTVVPTVLSAGTTMNTVPAQGKFTVDVRVRNLAEQQRVDEAMRALEPVLDGAKVEVTGGPNRAPLELSASAALFELASGLADFELTQASVGGASDGNFTAGVGVPTLDGLGAVGGGAHAESEHVLVSELVPRTTLLAALVRELT
ncbi:M20 family metallopeptidase, partial [Lentzea aerocolonigenes]|uniref:M20 family metallopeptidase n=1 Tax=Lentzea aerocolonigenes TaxID=68170 RepID=UPI0004C2CB86